MSAHEHHHSLAEIRKCPACQLIIHAKCDAEVAAALNRIEAQIGFDPFLGLREMKRKQQQ